MPWTTSRLLGLTMLCGLATSCSHPHCPACLPPPPQTQLVKAPTCSLPSLPADLPPAVGFPDPKGVMLSKSDWATLTGYTAGLKAWIVAAAACLESR